MLRPYDRLFSPPAPTLSITVECAAGFVALRALIDTGADVSVLPRGLASQLGLPPSGLVEVRYSDGPSEMRPIYVAKLEIAERRLTVEVIEGGSEALIGRDALAHLTVTLDGPRQTLEIT